MERAIGYKRVSTADQRTDRQLEGIRCDTLFEEKVSAKDANRPQLKAMIHFAQAGDTVVVHSIDRLARSLSDLLEIIETLRAKGVTLVFVSENMKFGGEENPIQNMVMQIAGAFAEFERKIISNRIREGLAAAKAKGTKIGREHKLSDEDFATLLKRRESGESVTSLAKSYGVGRSALYRRIKQHAEG